MSSNEGSNLFSAHEARDLTKSAFKTAFEAFRDRVSFTVKDLAALLDTDASTVAAWLDLGRDPTPPGWVERRLLSVHAAMGTLYRAEMDRAFCPRAPKASMPRILARVQREAAHLDIEIAEDWADDGVLNRDHSPRLAALTGASAEAMRHEAPSSQLTLLGGR